MLFSSTVFLFCFLPAVFISFYVVKPALRMYVLLIFSLLFYVWGEPRHLAVMLFICFTSYWSAVLLGTYNNKFIRKLLVILAIIVDLGILCYFKYLNFILDNINSCFNLHENFIDVVMPIGISFFTFQAMSYIIDVYRGDADVQKNFMKLTLYISLFPQLIAGPIVKYRDIEVDLNNNQTNLNDIVLGFERFIIGLGKKVLIANPLGAVADSVFQNGYHNADMSIAWLGAIAYSLQLFFDFSGYSDMAIGLGRVFGFHFLENFNYPYISKSITEFWRRWHISLGSWFREYVYFPLGGNRNGKSRTYLNLLIVFAVTGAWHGANWTFIVWGMWHGLFIVIERIAGVKNWREDKFTILRHIYTIFAFVIGWTIFRADTIKDGVGMVGVMLGIHSTDYIPFDIEYYLSPQVIITLFLGIIFSLPIMLKLSNYDVISNTVYGHIMRKICLLAIYILAISSLAASTYNPFIYFRF